MVEFIKLTSDKYPIWNEYVHRHPHSEIFHLAEWGRIYKETYNYTPHYYFLKEGTAIVGVLPLMHQKGLLKNIIVTPPSGILLDSPVLYNQQIFHFVYTLKEKLKTSNVVIYNQHKISSELSESTENIRIEKELPDTIATLNKDIGKKRRWGVRKAEENGMTHTILKPEYKDIKTFYRIYGTNYRDLGTPVHSRLFFSKQVEHLGDHVKMMIVRKGEMPICVKWLLEYKSTILSSDSATLREFFPLRINDYQIYHAMKYAIEQGFRIYSMGRSQRGSGTFSFKVAWGECQIHPYPVYSMKEQAGITEKKSKYSLFIRIWQKTPTALTNIAGPIIRKNMSLD